MTIELGSRHRGPSHVDHHELQVNCDSTTSAAQDRGISFLGKFVVLAGTTLGAGLGAVGGGYIAVFGSAHCKNAVSSYIQGHMYLGHDYQPWHSSSIEEESSAVGSACAIKCASMGAGLGAATGYWLSIKVAERFF